MTNPYADRPAAHFWKTAVAEVPDGQVIPLAASAKAFRLTPTDRLATAGSCFAQNVAKHLRASGRVRFLQTEPLGDDDPVFSGRYGNIYTARQLIQLTREVLDGPVDTACAIRRNDGRYVDANRPFINAAGFASAAEVVAARESHLAAIRPVFTDADVFVFTLGLTEAWVSGDGARVYPVCPGIYADDPAHPYRFHNFGVAEVTADMEAFLARLAAVNPAARVLLTVSPVPLTATATDDHILTATMMSKAVLRAVAGDLASRFSQVYYFPSYEMIANPFRTGHSYADNLRSVDSGAIARVMAVFDSHYLGDAPPPTGLSSAAAAPPPEDIGKPRDDVICDDVQIERSIGF